ncbi:MAG: hypothetical protein LUM44_22235 [Pyrinomonadaceae bacterium]|nr:hypothetical protein [Pyrinomonadaceae bacterium]
MTIRCLFFALVFLSAALSVDAQPQTSETAVRVLREIGGRDFSCTTDSGVMTKAGFEKLISDKQCADLKSKLNVDFEKESLIGFRAGSDCHMQASAKVFQNDAAKKYVVKVDVKYGGCRAAGNYQGWLVVEKLKPGYTVEFTERNLKKIYTEWLEKDVTYFPAKPSAENLETKQIDLKGCIQTNVVNEFVIKTQYQYLKSLRKDAGNYWCVQNLAPIDFEKYSLLGIGMTTDYCTVPRGLEYKLSKDAENKQYLFSVSYLQAEQLCRRLGHYDLWLLVPKLEEDYSVKFDLQERPN